MDLPETSHGSDGYELVWHDEHLHLLPERAVWLPSFQTLLVADIHLGKEAAFRAASIPVPDVTAADLTRLTSLIQKTECQRLIILGDMVHSAQGLTPQIVNQTAEWRRTHEALSIQLVLGNHDLRSGRLPEAWKIECDDEIKCGPFRLLHHPVESSDRPCIAGHLHPKYRLRTATDSATLPSFVLKDDHLILPAFGTLVDGQAVDLPASRNFVISDDTILEIQAVARTGKLRGVRRRAIFNSDSSE